ncbi:MAG: class I SAM-dependent methyltransferase [Nitrospirota bacterium]
MSHHRGSIEKKQAPYSEAAGTGQYAKRTGLAGKYDNVRRFWEDEVTRLFLRSYLKDIVDAKARRLERLRVLDLGCGVGDGYDLLTGVTAKEPGLYEYAVELMDKKMLGLYKGIDINLDLIAEASEYYGGDERIAFEAGDFSAGLRLGRDAPYDVYFTSYGTVSHFTTEQTVRLLADIARHAAPGALVVLDWLGRYSYEWQDLWTEAGGDDYFMDYRISYIYPPEERSQVEIQSFPLRLLSRADALAVVEEAGRLSGVTLEVERFFDRSIFVGRHMDTAEYNRHCPAVRQAVNSLLEPNTRTDLTALLMDYHPRNGFPALNAYFEKFFLAWNALVVHVIEFLSAFGGEGGKGAAASPDLYKFYPEPLRRAVSTMERVVETTGDLPGDARANIIEPQLAYALRRLEMELQSGEGTGHGFAGVITVRK